MRRRGLRLAAVVAWCAGLATLAGACSTNLQSTETTVAAPVAEPVTMTINLLGNHFDTEEVTIPVGSTIIFHNTTSADHGIISSVFDADLRPGQDFQYTFNQAGVFEVHSRTHVSAPGIYCRITVQ